MFNGRQAGKIGLFIHPALCICVLHVSCSRCLPSIVTDHLPTSKFSVKLLCSGLIYTTLNSQLSYDNKELIPTTQTTTTTYHHFVKIVLKGMLSNVPSSALLLFVSSALPLSCNCSYRKFQNIHQLFISIVRSSMVQLRVLSVWPMFFVQRELCFCLFE